MESATLTVSAHCLRSHYLLPPCLISPCLLTLFLSRAACVPGRGRGWPRACSWSQPLSRSALTVCCLTVCCLTVCSLTVSRHTTCSPAAARSTASPRSRRSLTEPLDRSTLTVRPLDRSTLTVSERPYCAFSLQMREHRCRLNTTTRLSL
jgi:hypothetical protein